jgi:hypothetical protein
VDNRRRRYVPMDVYAAFGKTGTKLLQKWGMEGLCAWLLLLAAAKREPTQGTFTYATDAEAWAKVGAQPVAFTFQEFVTYTGRLKQTRKTQVGRIKHVEITQWGQWNKDWDRQHAADEKARSRAQNTPYKPPTQPGRSPDVSWTEVEVDLEVEGESKGSLVVRGDDLPFEKQQKITKLLRWCGDDADTGTAHVLAGIGGRLHEGGLAKVLESCLQATNVKDRAAYAVAALKCELKEAV